MMMATDILTDLDEAVDGTDQTVMTDDPLLAEGKEEILKEGIWQNRTEEIQDLRDQDPKLHLQTALQAHNEATKIVILRADLCPQIQVHPEEVALEAEAQDQLLTARAAVQAERVAEVHPETTIRAIKIIKKSKNAATTHAGWLHNKKSKEMDTTENKDKNAAVTGADKSKNTAGKSTAETGNTNAAETAKEKATAKTAASKAANQGQQTGDTSSSQTRKPSEADKEGPLFKFFTDMLKDMYYAEKHILEALPKMQKAATTDELQDAFEDHHLQTQKQISRLEKVFKMIGEEAEAKKCDAIEGIVKEGEKCIEETEDGSMTRDAALIIAAQKVEHYEIASYGGLCALAETLGHYDASELLHITLEEETKTDSDLTHIAEGYINFYASEDDSDEEWDDDDDDWDDEYNDDDDYDNDYESYDRRDNYRRQSYH